MDMMFAARAPTARLTASGISPKKYIKVAGIR